MTDGKEELEIEIDKTGQVTIRVHGLKGKFCLKKSQEVANLVGKIKSRTPTSDYYDPGPTVWITDKVKHKTSI